MELKTWIRWETKCFFCVKKAVLFQTYWPLFPPQFGKCYFYIEILNYFSFVPTCVWDCSESNDLSGILFCEFTLFSKIVSANWSVNGLLLFSILKKYSFRQDDSELKKRLITGKFCPHLGFLFSEVPLVERYKIAKEVGFKAVDSGFPLGYTKEQVAAAKNASGLQQILIEIFTGQFEIIMKNRLRF